ncbi:MAG: hypothetical protein ACE5I7_05490, partial [Candidatus Binatia bacterium]
TQNRLPSLRCLFFNGLLVVQPAGCQLLLGAAGVTVPRERASCHQHLAAEQRNVKESGNAPQVRE